jgi:hypothetical protein
MRLLPAVALLLWCAAPAAGQPVQTRLTVSGFTGAFGVATAANYVTGWRMAPSNMTIEVRNTAGAHNRRTRVTIEAGSATLGATKPIGDVQWKFPHEPATAWRPLSTAPTDIHSQTLAGVNSFWQQTLEFRCLLSWTADPPSATALTAPLVLRLIVSPP